MSKQPEQSDEPSQKPEPWSEPSFELAVNTIYQDKVKPGDGRFWQFNMTFTTRRLTLPALLGHIRRGHAWCAPHAQVRHHRPTRRNPNYQTTYRVKANVSHCQLLALDSDTGDEQSAFASLMQDPFIARYVGLLHSTASSTPEQPRSRIIFLLEEPLPTADYEAALKALLHRFPFCDQSVNHAAAVFYGAQNCDYLLTNQVLPLRVLQAAILELYQNFVAAEQQKRAEARAARLAAYGSRQTAEPGQVAAYVQAVCQNAVEELAAAPSGRGLRHQQLYAAAYTLGGLQTAPWMTAAGQAMLREAPEALLEAAEANGYIADYGEEDALRTIDDGLAQGAQRPLDEPVWYAPRPFFQVGDWVQAVVGGVVKAEGRVRRLREGRHWEYELESRPHVWFARELLVAPNAEAGSP